MQQLLLLLNAIINFMEFVYKNGLDKIVSAHLIDNH